MHYTDLDIHQAIDLVKAGCEDVWCKNESDAWYIQQKVWQFRIEELYRIKTSKLKEWNDNKKCPKCTDGKVKNSMGYLLLDCPKCNGTGTTIDNSKGRK